MASTIFFAGKAVACQYPRQYQPEETINQRRCERKSETDFIGMHDALGCHRLPELAEARCRRFEKQSRQRDHHDDCQIKKRKSQRQSESRNDAGLFELAEGKCDRKCQKSALFK